MPTVDNMPETMYRSSRYFRVLGNPTAYMILRSLQKSAKTSSELRDELGRSITTVSDTLRNLRQVNLVRYDSVAKEKFYRIKDRRVLTILDKGELLAEKMRTLKE